MKEGGATGNQRANRIRLMTNPFGAETLYPTSLKDVSAWNKRKSAGWASSAEKARIMRDRRIANRRDFLTKCVTGVIAAVAADCAVPWEIERQAPKTPKSRVVIARDALLRGGTGSADSVRMLRLLDHSMQALCDADDAVRPWTQFVHRGHKVAIKVNTLGGRGLSSNVQLVEAVCERLQSAGVMPRDIVIFDRNSEELERTGFRIRMGGNQVQCFGTDRVGYEDEFSEFGEIGSLLSKILTRQCDVMINVPVLKDHDGAGVSIALKNMYGVIHNPNKYHANGCDPYVADVNALPAIRAKVRLHICDATTACYEGGPAFKPQFAWHENALMISEDPVALDQTGWQLIERKRAEKGLKTLEADGRMPRYIATAADPEHRVGTNVARRIELIGLQVA